MRPVLALLWAKLRIARHTVAGVRHESRLKVGVLTIAATGLWVGAFFLFYGGFGYLRDFVAALGPDVDVELGFNVAQTLMERLLAIFAVSIFFLLSFSNVLISFATFYRAKEVYYLMHTPLSMRQYFYARFAESVFVSSWSLAYLGSPLMLAYGLQAEAAPAFYAALLFFYVPYIIIPACLGAVITMVLVRVFPALKVRTMIFLGVLAVGLLFLYLRSIFGASDVREDDLLPVLFSATETIQSPFLPSTWAAEGVLAAGRGEYGESLFQFALLMANAAMAMWLSAEIAQRILHRGFSTLAGQDRQRIRPPGRGIINRLTPLLRPIPNPHRALVLKDIKLFWRDPVQWSQFVIFFGILAIYFANLHRSSRQLEDDMWRSWIACMNVGSVSLIVSVLTSRFMFPLVSLEGRRFWILGLAPLTFRQLVLQKYWLSVGTVSGFTVGLAVLSGMQLQLEPVYFWLTVYSVVLCNIGLSGLAVGLGTLYPNFQEDNPARIVGGMGGTLNLLISVGYITLVVAGQVLILQWRAIGAYTGDEGFLMALSAVFVFITLLTGVCTWLPMRLGLRHLNRLEF